MVAVQQPAQLIQQAVRLREVLERFRVAASPTSRALPSSSLAPSAANRSHAVISHQSNQPNSGQHLICLVGVGTLVVNNKTLKKVEHA